MDVIEQSGMTTAAAALTGQLVGSDDILTDGGAGGSSASMNPLEDDLPVEDSQASDMRLKTDICKVGTTVYGLPLYHFRYKGQETVYEGVMAQDVADAPGCARIAHEVVNEP
jgi:hypothetical protein